MSIDFGIIKRCIWLDKIACLKAEVESEKQIIIDKLNANDLSEDAKEGLEFNLFIANTRIATLQNEWQQVMCDYENRILNGCDQNKQQGIF